MNNKKIVGGKLTNYLVNQEKGLLLMNFLFFKGEVHPKYDNFISHSVWGTESNGEGPRCIQ